MIFSNRDHVRIDLMVLIVQNVDKLVPHDDHISFMIFHGPFLHQNVLENLCRCRIFNPHLSCFEKIQPFKFFHDLYVVLRQTEILHHFQFH